MRADGNVENSGIAAAVFYSGAGQADDRRRPDRRRQVPSTSARTGARCLGADHANAADDECQCGNIRRQRIRRDAGDRRQARHNSADEVLYLAHEKILGPQMWGSQNCCRLLQDSTEPTSVKRATASAEGTSRQPP